MISKKGSGTMTYEDLYEGMELICDKTDGTKQVLKVVRKGIDGFGCESVVFQFPSGGQAYCRKNDVPNWYIKPNETEISKLKEMYMIFLLGKDNAVDFFTDCGHQMYSVRDSFEEELYAR